MDTETQPLRVFGRTGRRVPAFGLGGGALNDCYGRPTNDEWAVATVRRALELGVRYFDTSAGYGESERRMGLGLAGWPRDAYFLATKTGTRFRERDYSRDATLRSVEESLRLLRVDYLDLVLVHDPQELAPALAPGGAVEALEQLRRQGVVRAIGLGVRSHALHRQALRDGRFDALLTYLDYTLLDQSALSLIDEAHAAGVAVILGSPLGAGLLSGRPPAEIAAERRLAPESPEVAGAQALAAWAESRGESLPRLALRFCIEEPRAAVTIAAARTPDEVEANVSAARLPVSPDTWEALARAGFEAGRLRLERRRSG